MCASNIYYSVNKFYNYATGAGVFKYAPGVKFVENTIQPGEEA